MANGDSTDPETLGSRVVYENRWMRVREDRTRRHDGSEGIYGFVEEPDFVIIAPVQDGVVHLVQQFRYPIRQRQWEFPQGSWEERPDALPEDIARGELKEETGLVARTITEVGHLFPLYGTATQGFRIFFATGLEQRERDLDAEEQDLIARAFRLAAVDEMILNGEIQDAATIASLSMLRLRRVN